MRVAGIRSPDLEVHVFGFSLGSDGIKKAL